MAGMRLSPGGVLEAEAHGSSQERDEDQGDLHGGGEDGAEVLKHGYIVQMGRFHCHMLSTR